MATIVQAEAYDSLAVSTTPATVPGTTGSFTAAIGTGGTICVVLQQTTANIRTYTVEDDSTGSYTAMTAGPAGTNSNRKAWIFYRENVSGTINVRITCSASETVQVRCFELSAGAVYDNATSRVGALADVTASGYPTAADAASIDTQANCALIAALTLTATGGGLTAGSGWSNGAGNGTTFYSQTKESASALANEQGFVAEAGTNRDYASAIISFYTPSAGGAAVGKGLTQSNRLSRMRLAA